MPFSNTQINVDEIPTIQDIEYTQLSKDFLRVNMISTFLIWIVIFAVVTTIFQFDQDDDFFNEMIKPKLKWLMLGLLSLAVINLVVSYFGFFKKGYAIREKDISYKKGLFWRTKTLVPFNRIQHCELNQGPIERMFGLSSLKVFTAGGSSSDLNINGLVKGEAEQLKQFILKKTAADEEE